GPDRVTGRVDRRGTGLNEGEVGFARAPHGQRRDARGRIALELDGAVLASVAVFAGLDVEPTELDADPRRLTEGAHGIGELLGDRLGASANLFVELGAWEGPVDELPLDRLLAADALGRGREHVGQVTPDFA